MMPANENKSIQPTRFSRFRFTLAALLFVILCVAGLLAGYRFGFKQGYAIGARKRSSEAPYAVVYPVQSLVIRKGNPPNVPPDFDSLIECITQSIRPETWTDAGGVGSIEVMPVNLTIVVSQTKDVHEQISKLLQDMQEATEPASQESSAP